MIIIKWTILILIISVSSFIGNTFANKYKDRVKELKQTKNALNILKTKITYTYEPLPQIFSQISQEFENNIGDIFKKASTSMGEKSAGEAWKEAIKTSNTNLQKEDLKILENLDKLLGKTNAERTNKRNRTNLKIHRRTNNTCRRRTKKKRKTI